MIWKAATLVHQPQIKISGISESFNNNNNQMRYNLTIQQHLFRLVSIVSALYVTRYWKYES